MTAFVFAMYLAESFWCQWFSDFTYFIYHVTSFSMNLWNQPVSKATDIWYTWDIWPGCFCFGTASHILEEISKFIRVWIQLIIKRSSSQMFTTVFRIQLLIMWSKNLVQSLWRFDHFSGSYEVAKFWNRRKWRHHRECT